MIPWHASNWSLNDLLAALGFKSRHAGMGRRDLMLRGRICTTGNYDETVYWLCSTGQIEWTPSALRHKAMLEANS